MSRAVSNRAPARSCGTEWTEILEIRMDRITAGNVLFFAALVEPPCAASEPMQPTPLLLSAEEGGRVSLTRVVGRAISISIYLSI